MATQKTQHFEPRPYQTELLMKALKKNIIVCLGTGAGKTFIGVMLIRELSSDVLKPYEEGGKRSFFITKTVPLVAQQAAVLRSFTNLNVGEYTGAMGVDYWSKDKWEEELKENQILVMTTQILTNILGQAYLHPQSINLLIIDECHHAVKNDPIVQIMRRFNDFDYTPKILGLTASVLNGKSKLSQVETKIRNLEKNLSAVVETPTNQKLASVYATNPEETVVAVKVETHYDDLKVELSEYLSSVLRTFPENETTKDNFDIEDEDLDILYLFCPNVKFSNTLKDMMYIINEMGLWCAYEVAQKLTTDLDKLEVQLSDEVNTECFNKVKKALQFVIDVCSERFEYESLPKLLSSEVSNKIKRLKEILLSFLNSCIFQNCEPSTSNTKNISIQEESDEAESTPVSINETLPIRSIIFVERRVAAWVLNHYLQKISEELEEFRLLKPDYVIGHGSNPAHLKFATMKSKHQALKVLNFRNGLTNILVATRVVEEGMDITTCNLIIRFDEPKDFRSYVQSKGRARSQDSHYIILVSKPECQRIKEEIQLYKQIEKTLYDICHERLPPTEEEIQIHLLRNVLGSYYADETNKMGPAVSPVDAIGRVNWYCQLLPHDKLTSLTPRVMYKRRSPPHNLLLNNEVLDFDFDDAESGFFDEYEIIPMDEVGRIWYQAFLKLPLNSPYKDVIEGDIMPTKKLSLQSVALKTCEALHKSGELNDDLLPVMKDLSVFLSQLTDIEEDQVPDDSPKPGNKKRRQIYEKQTADAFIGYPPQPEMNHYMYRLKLNVIANEGTDLPLAYYPDIENQYIGLITTKSLPMIEPFPLYASKYKVWVEVMLENMITLHYEQYMLLKLFQEYLTNEVYQFDCGIVLYNPTLSKECYFIAPLKNVGNDHEPCIIIDWELLQNIFCTDHHTNLLSNKERRHFDFNYEHYQDAIVTALYHTKKCFYLVEQICGDKTPLSTFPQGAYKTFYDYYSRKYNLEIQNNNQSLLQVKLIPLCINMLPEKSPRKRVKKEDGYFVYFVPELCAIHPIPATFFLQAQYIPSIIYRLNSLLLADELGSNVLKSINMNFQKNYPHATWSNIEVKCRSETFENCNENSWKEMFHIEFGKDDVQENEGDIPPTSIILKALISKSANDCIDLERLETLGDSFLKYSTSIFMFLNFPLVDEGRLTLGRSKLVSNSHLYHLGKVKRISNILHTNVFSPNYNWLPSGHVVDMKKEGKLLESKIPFHLWKYVWKENLTSMSVAEIQSLVKEKKAIDSDESLELDPNVYNNMTCQLINDKTVADSIEALIGAHLLYVGPDAALRFMTWLGLKILPRSSESSDKCLEPFKIPTTACNKYRNASEKLMANLDKFEYSIGYIFRDKSFLLQAFTHPSYVLNMVTDCYQRLEFLGDAVLDYLITWNIYKNEKNFSPGEISDLRSALVNNITFAYLAVQNNYHKYLKHFSPKLFDNIDVYLKLRTPEEADCLLISEDDAFQTAEVEVPKALGDIFESVAGAIYLDSGLSLDAVWEVYSPMMTPLIETFSKNIPKDPVRQVYELFPDVKIKKQKLEQNEENFYIVTFIASGQEFIGKGKDLKTAKRNAAKITLRNLKV